MSHPEKPKNVDLRARLGRKQSPGHEIPGTGPSVAPGVGSGRPLPAPPGTPKRPSIIPGQSLQPPPFVSRTQSPPSAFDPFTAKQQAVVQEVRLVVDDQPVADTETGRQTSRRFVMVGAAFLLAGSVLGYFTGNAVYENKLWTLVRQDVRDIYDAIDKAAPAVGNAQTHITQALAAASPAAGQTASVDFAALSTLKAIVKPFDASKFARKRYSAMAPGTVDTLFAYYNNINLIWDRMEVAIAKAERNKEDIQKAAAAAAELSTVQYGCIPMSIDDSIACGLGVVALPPPKRGEKLPTKLRVSQSVGSMQVEKTRYQGQELKNNASDFVILIDTRSSVGVLGQQASAFASYRRDLVELKKLADETVELQGTLLKELSKLKNL